MSTRGLIGFAFDGKRLFTYNHSDSYPDWLGLRMLRFARTLTDPNVAAATLAGLRSLTEVNELESPTPEQRAALGDRYHANVSTGQDWYAVLRETQGDPAAIITSGYIASIGRGPETFGGSWTDIAFSYEVNLDERWLRCYQGEPSDAYVGFDFDALPADEQFIAALAALEE